MPRRRRSLTVVDIRRKLGDLGVRQPMWGGVGKEPKRNLESEIAELRNKLALEVRKLVPSCRVCGSDDILLKISRHFVRPGNDIVGPGSRGPEFATHIDGLYCEQCGAFYYNSKIAALDEIVSDIEDTADDVREAKGGVRYY